MDNYLLLLHRKHYYDSAICGTLSLFSCDTMSIVFTCDTLESSTKFIPKGLYPLEITYSPKFGCELPIIFDVPNRDGIRIHSGNDSKDTTGCILVGKHTYDCSYIYESKSTLDLLMSYLEDLDIARIYIV